MNRNFLFAWYETPRGKLLKQLEADYIQRSITVSCQQTILQVGGLGWENEFIDCSLYKHFIILDAKNRGCEEALKIQAKASYLPLKSDSVDMIILPHLLEFDAFRFQTIREVERVLKPEGIILVLNFNPWSFWIRYQYLWDKKMADSWGGHFISRSRITDWLKLLNFEISVCSQFYLDSVVSTSGKNNLRKHLFSGTAYAVKAIKRRYNLIPLTPIKSRNPSLVLAGSINSPAHKKKHD
ncbi:MAG: methyltransferase domain-containing protein [Methylococcaceae bacterium]|nr:methyltransferase domain-containing protein [Methylococcaceae bacterium]